jgi:hypothetical protein
MINPGKMVDVNTAKIKLVGFISPLRKKKIMSLMASQL